MQEVFDAFSTRIKSPYFGYTILAFLAINWREIFILMVSQGPPHLRVEVFNHSTNFWSLLAYPLGIGVFLAIATPWSRFLFDWISQKPFEMRDRLRIVAEHNKTILQTDLENSRAKLFAQREEELIQRAKRDEKIASIDDKEVQEKLNEEISNLRREHNRLSQRSSSKDPIEVFSNLDLAEIELLTAASENEHGMIRNYPTLDGESIEAGTKQFGFESARSLAKYQAALESLLEKELVREKGDSGELFVLTHEGWELSKSF